MGSEVKKVPFGFDWPLNKIWPGFLDWPNSKNPMLEPPTGDCFQLWETTSHGSPMSPVFETPRELAKWIAGESPNSSYDEWLNFVYASLGRVYFRQNKKRFKHWCRFPEVSI